MKKLLFAFLWTTSLSAAAAAPIVSARISGAGIEVESSVVLPIEPCKAYAMLTDYDDLARFVPGLFESRSERISPNEAKVLQVGEVRVLIFKVKMTSLLDMEEFPGKRIVFRQISGDFSSYGGEWDFSAVEGGTRVSYRARMVFKPYVPLFLAKSVLDEDLEKKFAAIADAASERRDLECAGS